MTLPKIVSDFLNREIANRNNDERAKFIEDVLLDMDALDSDSYAKWTTLTSDISAEIAKNQFATFSTVLGSDSEVVTLPKEISEFLIMEINARIEEAPYTQHARAGLITDIVSDTDRLNRGLEPWWTCLTPELAMQIESHLYDTFKAVIDDKHKTLYASKIN